MIEIPHTMLAAVLHAPLDMRIEQIPIPICGIGDVLLQVGAAMTCGTDFKTYRRGHPVLVKSYPSAFGHEVAGTIVSVGSDVKNFKIGDRVVTANSGPCLQCFFCYKGQENLCDDLIFLNGAFAEYIAVPARIVQTNLQILPQTLHYKEAVLTEPLACVLHAAELMQLKADETIILFGSGPMSQLFVQVAKSFGAQVIVLGRSQEKLDVAKQLGADKVYDVRMLDDSIASIRAVANEGRGADLVVEAIGSPETWKQALAMSRKGGRVCLFGGCPRDAQFVADAYRMHYEQITVSGVFHYTPRYFKMALDLLSSGTIDVSPLIVEEKRLSDLDEVFYPDRQSNPLKIAVIP
jgi:L-iditol 2-dehydrogenase